MIFNAAKSARYRVLSASSLKDILPYALAMVSALVAGLVTAQSNSALVAMMAAVAVGAVASIYPVLIFWLALLVAYVGAGITQLYFPSLQLIRWSAIPLSMLMLLYVILQSMVHLEDDHHKRNINLLTFLLTSFFLVNIFSGLFNATPFADVIIGLKGYFQLWGILFALALLQWDGDLMRRALPKMIFVLALIQLPFALHQYFFVAPARVGLEKGIVPLDIVSGTFGGVLSGGGANAVLAVFLISVWAVCLALWKKGYLSAFSAIVLSAVLLIPVTINEAKVSIIYAMVVFFIIFRKGILQNFQRFLGVAVLVLGIVVGLFSTYIAHAPEGKASSWSELIVYTIEYNLLKEEAFDGKLSRGGSIDLWVEDRGDVPHTLFGYGVGATRVDKRNDLAAMLGITSPQDYGVGNLAAIAVLWESGVVGFAILNLIFVVSFIYASQLEKRHDHDPWLSGIFLGLQGAIAILYISLWHKNFFVFHIGYQIILVTLFGYLVYWRRQPVRPEVDEPSAAHELAFPNQ